MPLFRSKSKKPYDPRNIAGSTATEYGNSVRIIVDQSCKLGYSDLKFEDLGTVLAKAEEVSSLYPEDKVPSQSTRPFPTGTADDAEAQSIQELPMPAVPDSDKDQDTIAESFNFCSSKELPDSADIYKIYNSGLEPTKQDSAQNYNTADIIDTILDSAALPTKPDLEDALSDSSRTQLTSAENRYQSKDQPPNREKSIGVDLSLPGKYSPSSQERRYKQTLPDYKTITGLQPGKSVGILTILLIIK
jgi:hypothetical protein